MALRVFLIVTHIGATVSSREAGCVSCSAVLIVLNDMGTVSLDQSFCVQFMNSKQSQAVWMTNTCMYYCHSLRARNYLAS